MALQLSTILELLIWALLITVVLIGIPAWISHAIFSDGSFRSQMGFLILNFLILILGIFGSYIHFQMMITAQAPFDLESFFKVSMVLGMPFLVNILMMIFLSSSQATQLTPSARKYSIHQRH